MKKLNLLKNILARDFLLEIYTLKARYLILYSYIFFINIIYSYLISKNHGNLMDLFYNLYKSGEYVNNLNYIPVNWILINILILFITGDFIHNNLKNDSINVILKSEKLSIYWISKCIWIVINVIFIYISMFIITYILGGFILGFELEYSSSLESLFVFKIPPLKFIAVMLLLYILTSIATVFIQSILSLRFKSKHSFFITISINLLSTYCNNKFLIGIHSMILKHNWFERSSDLSIFFSIIYILLLIILLIVLGYRFLKNKDFI